MKTRLIILLSAILSLGAVPTGNIYNRSDWMRGGKWADVDHDCQDTRQEVLIKDNIGTLVLSPDGCKVISGKWYGAYSDQFYTNPKDLDLDHFVPLKNAHDSGGALWNDEQRGEYANNLDQKFHLILVDKNQNRKKGAKGPDGYLPENNKCWYVVTWLYIKMINNLYINDAENKAIIEVLGGPGCKRGLK